jgi:hypothetical protein
MWEKLRKQNDLCARYCAELEDLPMGAGVAAACSEVNNIFSPGLIEHAEECDSCREATEVFWASRNLLAAPVQQMHEEARARVENAPWFAARVMANIDALEAKTRSAKLEWSGAVTRLASRLAWASALMLLVTSTLLYDPQPRSATKQTNTVTGQAATETPQYLFDSVTALSNVDDALAAPAER